MILRIRGGIRHHAAGIRQALLLHRLMDDAPRGDHGALRGIPDDQQPHRARAEPDAQEEILPFVVEKMTVRARGSPTNSRGEAPTSKPSILTASRSPPSSPSPSRSRSATPIG